MLLNELINYLYSKCYKTGLAKQYTKLYKYISFLRIDRHGKEIEIGVYVIGSGVDKESGFLKIKILLIL